MQKKKTVVEDNKNDFSYELYKGNISLGPVNEFEINKIYNGMFNYLLQNQNKYAILMASDYGDPLYCSAFIGDTAQSDAINMISKGLFEIPTDTKYVMMIKK